MATIVTRSGKGSALTFVEADANFTNLNTDKVELTDLSVTTATSAETSALTYNNATGVLTFTPVTTGDLIALDDLSVSTLSPSGGGSLSYNNSTGVFDFTPAAGLANVVEDTTPQLGGNLDVNGNDITTSETNGDITLQPHGTGNIVMTAAVDFETGNLNTTTTNGDMNVTANGTGAVVLGPKADLSYIRSFAEVIETMAPVSGTLSIDASDGPIKYVVPSGAMTINGFASPLAGQTVTLLVDNATNSSNFGITLGAGLLTPEGDGVSVTNSGYDLVTITCVDATNGLYVVTSINDFQ